MSHRDIDIDRFYQDDLIENLEYLSTQTEPEALAILQQITTQVRDSLSHRQPADALIAALSNPPYGKGLGSVQDQYGRLVMEVLFAVRSTEIPAILKQLDDDQKDVLMKYIYYGMSRPKEYNSSTLLSWHEKIVAVSGIASIVRVLTDRKHF
ncbi:arp2/3 complex subunit [Mycoemilia scoparia]|uniref:Actin-related protein 2/3 complex subunit 5 n=1 Tax=Mycoemilia scoparia TaxID=417184 RepID=A0A9W7ZV89_9FUNG|nr:arp2/3 complex subunit [Mycoemilia scoparia]